MMILTPSGICSSFSRRNQSIPNSSLLITHCNKQPLKGDSHLFRRPVLRAGKRSVENDEGDAHCREQPFKDNRRSARNRKFAGQDRSTHPVFRLRWHIAQGLPCYNQRLHVRRGLIPSRFRTDTGVNSKLIPVYILSWYLYAFQVDTGMQSKLIPVRNLSWYRYAFHVDTGRQSKLIPVCIPGWYR